MSTASGIIQALQCGRSACLCYRASPGRGNVHCPAHNDPGPSFHVSEAEGKVLWKCYAGCSQAAVRQALIDRGLHGTPKDDNVVQIRSRERLTATYQYRTATGVLVAEKARFESSDGHKRFTWKLPDSETWSGLGALGMADMPLWGAELLAAGDNDGPVWFAEGEKATQALRDHGYLAVTHGGGASTTDFGTALHVLRGRDVVIWPDNDEPGYRYASRVKQALRGIARSVRVFSPRQQLEKDDAWDYFARGGTVEEIERDTPPSGPVVDYLSADAVRVRHPTDAGLATFTFSQMEIDGRDLNADLRVEHPGNEWPYPARLNLHSLSARTDIKRDLKDHFGGGKEWAAVVNTCIALASDGYMNQARALHSRDIADPGRPAWQIEDVLPAGEASILFARGAAGKTMLAIHMACCIAAGVPWLGKPTRAGAVLLVDYETRDTTWRQRMHRICRGLGLIPDELPFYYQNGRGVPLANQVESIRNSVDQLGISLIMIDSAAAAVGDRPEDSQVAQAFFNALRKIPDVTVLILSHVSKSAIKEGDATSPFGSIMWENRARLTWELVRSQSGTENETHVVLTCRKVNDGPIPPQQLLSIRYGDYATLGAIHITAGDWSDAPDLDASRPITERITARLKARPMMTVEELAAELEAKPATIKTMLNAGAKAGRFMALPDPDEPRRKIWRINDGQLAMAQ